MSETWLTWYPPRGATLARVVVSLADIHPGSTILGGPSTVVTQLLLRSARGSGPCAHLTRRRRSTFSRSSPDQRSGSQREQRWEGSQSKCLQQLRVELAEMSKHIYRLRQLTIG
jgi:hypothetical protein